MLYSCTCPWLTKTIQRGDSAQLTLFLSYLVQRRVRALYLPLKLPRPDYSARRSHVHECDSLLHVFIRVWHRVGNLRAVRRIVPSYKLDSIHDTAPTQSDAVLVVARTRTKLLEKFANSRLCKVHVCYIAIYL